MDKIIRNILKKIENEGYEAYIVGGVVRDNILGKHSYDVDICTNALPKEIATIFPFLNGCSNGYGGFNFKLKKYSIDITTYRKEIKYESRKPVQIEYISNLLEDIKRRDFTMNSLCMDKKGNILDFLDGYPDIENKVIRVIGDPTQRFIDDPLRILRAIRFATILDFTIDKDAFMSIKMNAPLVKTLSKERIKEELSKILAVPNFKKGLELMKECNLKNILNIEYDEINYTSDILGMWAQINTPYVAFSNNEKESISRIQSILKRGKIDNFELFNNGLYLCTVAGEIMGISKVDINKLYKELPIKSIKELDISGSDIIDILKIEPGKLVSVIISDIKNEILNLDLKNKKSEIKKYIVRKWQK